MAGPKPATGPQPRVASMVSSSRSPTRLGCRLREQRERKRRTDATVAVVQWYASPWERAGRCLHTGYVIQKAKERRVLCNDEFGGRRLPSGFPLGGGRRVRLFETGPQRILFCRMDGWSRRRGHSDDLECPRAGWKWWGGMLSTTTVVKGDRAKGGWAGANYHARCYRAPLAEECIFAVLSPSPLASLVAERGP